MSSLESKSATNGVDRIEHANAIMIFQAANHQKDIAESAGIERMQYFLFSLI